MRVVSAAVLAPAALACLWVGSWLWVALVGVAAFGLAIEWIKLCGERPAARTSVALLLAVALAAAAAVLGMNAVLVLAVGAGVVWVLARRADLPAGVVYVGLGVVSLVWLRDDGAAGRTNVLFVVLIVWASDIGAYLVGRLVGGPKLAPAISPGKTWSGAAGGLIGAILVGGLVASLTDAAPSGRVFLVAGALGIVSQAGDLLESAIKRHFGVKDSGHVIPGHGGLLDRLDGVLAAAPAAALLALFLGRGGVLWR